MKKKVAMKEGKILIADDEATIVRGLSAVLEDEGYAVDIATDGQSALEHLTSETYGVMLLDLKMPKIDGIALLKEMQTREISTECIIVTGQATVDSAIQAMRHGAYDYIEKPLGTDKLTRLKALIPKALDKFNVKQANRALTSRLEELTHFGELTGQSEEMRDIYRIIEAVAPSTASVLILGESGTGKELVARALHSKSERAKGPFLALNCAALPKDILENELFGHEKGAFTGSTNEKPGAFEMADGGTIFLDEVAEMASDIQVKLLRALESRSIRRLGGKKEIAVDIRVVAATNKDLQKALADQDLREDLYYRLSVVDIFLPPLRERVGDIRLLAHEFLARFSQDNGKTFTSFDDSAWNWILGYHWPGNVRELKNAVERAVIMSRGTTIGVEDVMPRHLRSSGEIPAVVTVPVGSTLADARRQLALRTFASTAGDLERAAKILGMSISEVRAELLPLVSSNGRASESAPIVAGAPPKKAKPRPPAAKTSRKAKTKGRR
ncbi:MAG: sigma-54-dependent Fis family transcriptional regulator [Gemmatimonadaceae bacterium]|nr:sigma-54-dependent Fis family transcriptional regulator [Gemmatimonadaceae bacterium]